MSDIEPQDAAPRNLHQRINEVRKKIAYIKKDKAVQGYQAVTHDAVTALVRDHLIEFGVVIYPNLVSAVTVDTETMTSKETPIIRVEGVYEFTLVNIDDPKDTHTVRVSAHALDHGDKAPGKLLSYAKKAFVLKVFEIESGEDDESRYEGVKNVARLAEKKGRQPNPATKKEWSAITDAQRMALADMVTAISDALDIKDDMEAARLLYERIGATAGLDVNEAMKAVWSCFASDERTRITNAHNYLKQQKVE